MKPKRLLLFVAPLLLAACSAHRVADTGNLKYIRVVRYRSDDDSLVTNYTDYSSEGRIINALNHNHPEPREFEPDCRIHLVYPDSTVNVLINGSYMRYKGKVYRLNQSMFDVLN